MHTYIHTVHYAHPPHETRPPEAPGAPAAHGNNSYRLLIFPRDDYPNEWEGEVVVQDGRWYNAVVTIKGSTTSVAVAGQTWSTELGVDFSADSNGPQLGAYRCVHNNLSRLLSRT